MNRLWVRLSVAFVFVTVVGVASTAVLINRQVGESFLHFVARGHVMGLWQGASGTPLIARLAEHHAAAGGWSGVGAILDPGSGAGPGMGPGRGVAGRTHRVAGPSFALAGPDGAVVYDGLGGTVGRQLNGAERAAALPIDGEDGVVGYLVTGVPQRSDLSDTARAFLVQLNHTLLQAGLLAAAVGVLLGLVLARSLAAPLGRLAEAARRISRGDLQQQLPVAGADEVADVSRAFNEMVSGLQGAELLRRNMVADIAHELRTPLSVIQGNLRAVLDGVYPLHRDEVAIVFDETVVLSRLVEDLHELANAEAGQLTLRRDAIGIQTVVDRGLAAVREEAAQHGVELTADVDEGLPPVDIDADRISQVLRNLLTNAVRHTPPDGRVLVSAGLADEPGLVRVTVTDSGDGIDLQDLAHVFDRFWRADKSRSRDHGGSGLGLAIAKQLVEAHGGAIGAESSDGSGARFWFTVPIASQAARPQALDDAG